MELKDLSPSIKSKCTLLGGGRAGNLNSAKINTDLINDLSLKEFSLK